jgi:hypothetical protein
VALTRSRALCARCVCDAAGSIKLQAMQRGEPSDSKSVQLPDCWNTIDTKQQKHGQHEKCKQQLLLTVLTTPRETCRPGCWLPEASLAELSSTPRGSSAARGAASAAAAKLTCTMQRKHMAQQTYDVESIARMSRVQHAHRIT